MELTTFLIILIIIAIVLAIMVFKIFKYHKDKNLKMRWWLAVILGILIGGVLGFLVFTIFVLKFGFSIQ